MILNPQDSTYHIKEGNWWFVGLVEKLHTLSRVRPQTKNKVNYDNRKVPWEARKNKEDYAPSVNFSVQEGQVGNLILDEFQAALMTDLGKLLRK